MRVVNIGLIAAALPPTTGAASASNTASLSPTNPVERPRSCTLTANYTEEEGQYMSFQLLGAKLIPRWASVTAEYDHMSGYYFVDQVSVQSREETLVGNFSRLRYQFSPGKLVFDMSQGYLLGSEANCQASIVEGAKNMLRQGKVHEIYDDERKLDKKFDENPEATSPLIIYHHMLYYETIEKSHTEVVYNQDVLAPNWELPISMFSAIWSSTYNHAVMQTMIFTVPVSMKAPEIPLSTAGLNLVRSALQTATYSKEGMFNKYWDVIVLEVVRELLSDATIRAKAEQDDWDILVDEDDTDNIQMAFAETLILAVASEWNEEVKSYIPIRSPSENSYREMKRSLRPALSPSIDFPGAA